MRNSIKQSLMIAGLLSLLAKPAVAAPIFTPNSQPTGWVTRPVITAFDVSSGTRSFYQLDYRKDTWSGNVIAYSINSTARVQTTGPWDNLDPTITTAATYIDNADYSTGRKIVTLGGPLRWANLSSAEQTAVGSEAILNFVRGDRSNEEPNGLSFYQRESALGNIIHSTMYYWDDGTHQSLFVGSNDGMLHVFNANTGAENFAYVPALLIPRLGELAKNPFIHTHFVDGPITIASAGVNSSVKTILVGGLGAGGAGLFALDVTTPTAASETAAASKVLWEISAGGSFSNLGYTYGTPVIARLANDTLAVIIGNGYMNAGNGHAVLYIINALTGALIHAIDTGSGSAASPNGLSSPAVVDTDGDARPDLVYAGDIDGNVWKFNLSNNSASKIWTTSPVQAITTAPVVRAHPLGGHMVDFITGRILTTGDLVDTSVHYAYGIWDGAPPTNTQLVGQTLTESDYSTGGQTFAVRTVTSNLPNWSAGHDKGWKVPLMPGERVVGEMPFYNSGRVYFLATNPTIGTGENRLHELVFDTGGSPAEPIFDLNQDGSFNATDLAINGNVPVSKYLGEGVFSQPRLVRGDGLTTTLYTFHPNLPLFDGTPNPPDDPGVSGGHFDFDIYYYDAGSSTTTTSTPTDDFQTDIICLKTKDLSKELDKISKKGCVENPDISAGYDYLSDYSTGARCGEKHKKKKDNKYYQTVTCNLVSTTSVTSKTYKNFKHEHEYDDKYDVTGVNMLNASILDFNLPNAIADPDTPFKILVMNQYLNPAAKLSVGGVDYENVKTYANLASDTDPAHLLGSLTTYTRNTIGTLIYNLPLDAFKSKDWWGDGGQIRAGLIPTQTGCVNKVNADGSMVNSKDKGLWGPNGERFDGALTIQIIDPLTEHDHIELNGPDVRYGWRVKQQFFTDHVLAEYTSFWHHPNKFCYGDPGWIPDPPEDFSFSAGAEPKVPGSADPTDGVFGAGLSKVVTVQVVGNVTTTTTTYSDGSQYIKTETVGEDTTVIHQVFRDGTEETVTIYTGRGGKAGFIDPNTGSPEEELSTGVTGRQSWRDIFD